MAYGKSGSPPMSWVKMNVTAGTPSDCKSSRVMLQKSSLFAASTDGLALYYPDGKVLSPCRCAELCEQPVFRHTTNRSPTGGQITVMAPTRCERWNRILR